MGSRCELLAVGLPERALERAEDWVRAAEARFSRFEAASELSRLNQAGGAWTDVSPQMGRMLRACLDAYRRSNGLVNAAVLPALVAAGYSRRFTEGLTSPLALAPRPVPALPEVFELDLGRRRARLAPGCGLDLGGIAKGVLADELAMRLGENVVCNLGGDLRVRGDGLGDGWRVGLPDGQTVAMRSGALATSGTWKRRWGARLHHLIDPRTGAPAATDVRWVSVAADDGLSGEIHAKSAVLLGFNAGRRFLEARGLFHVMQRESSDEP